MKQKGGFNINPIQNKDFLYTRSQERIEWEQNAFPIGEYLIPLIQSIPWQQYRFQGITTIAEEREDEIVGIHTFSTNIEASMENFPFPYYFFGGCVYELIDRVYPNSIRNYIDPTGDIDVHLSLPAITQIPVEGDPYIDTVILPTGKEVMSPLIDHYTQWLYREWVKQIQLFSNLPFFPILFGNTVPFSYQENDEGKKADLFTQIHNLWIVRIPDIEGKMVKIQLLVKFTSTKESDHIVEFVLPLNCTSELQGGIKYESIQIKHESNTYMLLPTIPIASFGKLLLDNCKAMVEREPMRDSDEYRHKFFNHVGRIQYLNRILPPFYQTIQNKNEYRKAMNSLFPADFEKTLFQYLLHKRKTHMLWILDHEYKQSELDEFTFLRMLIGNMVQLNYYYTIHGRNGPKLFKYTSFANSYITELFTEAELQQFILPEKNIQKAGTRKRRKHRR